MFKKIFITFDENQVIKINKRWPKTHKKRIRNKWFKKHHCTEPDIHGGDVISLFRNTENEICVLMKTHPEARKRMEEMNIENDGNQPVFIFDSAFTTTTGNGYENWMPSRPAFNIKDARNKDRFIYRRHFRKIRKNNRSI